jgi:hypothetical protein
LVRYSAAELAPLIKQLDGARAPWLPGYRVKIISRSREVRGRIRYQWNA